MISSGIDPQLASRQADTQDLVRFKQEMDGLKKRLNTNGGEDKEKELRKACQDFEAVFISKLWKGMKSTVNKEGYLHSKQEEQYTSMFDRDFAERMAKAGGIGLADMIYDQLSQKLKQTSRDSLSGAVQIKPLADQPVMLNNAKGPIALPEREEMTLEDWGGNAAATARTTDAGTSAEIASALADEKAVSKPLSDVDVKARLGELTRRLEAERIKSGLLGSQPSTNGKNYSLDNEEQVGRKLAEIG